MRWASPLAILSAVKRKRLSRRHSLSSLRALLRVSAWQGARSSIYPLPCLHAKLERMRHLQKIGRIVLEAEVAAKEPVKVMAGAAGCRTETALAR